jgi:hypothetical protein
MKLTDSLRQLLANALKKSVDKLDTAETATFALELRKLKAKSYDVKYPDLKARKFVPVSHECSNADESFVVRQWDMAGMAKIISNYATDLPKVAAFAKEFVYKIKSIGDSFDYTIQDIRVSMQTGRSLSDKKQTIAYRKLEELIDDIAATGIPETQVPGVLNHPNIPLLTLPTGTWSSATDAQIVADLAYMVTQIMVTTKQTHIPDTVLFDTTSWARITQMVSGTGSFAETVLSLFLRTNPYIKNADTWIKLDTADAAGTGPRIFMYKRDSEVLELEIPQEPEQFPPQADGLAFTVNCHARVGGVRVSYPLACAYADNHY